MTMAVGCEHIWDAQQLCFVPKTDKWGATTVPGIFVAGDGGGIGGAMAACTRGELAAIGLLFNTRRISESDADAVAGPLRKKLRFELAVRPMLDAFFRPRKEIFEPSDDTIVCRCEELTAEKIREAAKIGQPGPNQLKTFTRAGMGPCQGRQCGYTVAHILAAEQGRTVAEVGFQRIRPPLKPITLREIASLDE
jgi:bacterioferritin-associated ferredoxin